MGDPHRLDLARIEQYSTPLRSKPDLAVEYPLARPCDETAVAQFNSQPLTSAEQYEVGSKGV